MVTCKCGHDKFHHFKEDNGEYAECLLSLDGKDMDFCPCGKYEEGEVEKHTLYILNTPILTEYGEYRFKQISTEDVVEKMGYGFTSAIGHEGTAVLLYQITGIPVPTNRIAIKMQPGDTAIVFRVLERLPEGKVLSYEELKNIQYKFGLLKRIR